MSGGTQGWVYLVGAGPGDPGLLTLRAASLLASADTVVHDRLIHPGVLEHARPHARLIYVGKEGGGDSVRQEDIHTLLIQQARLGRTVVRLKGGDPFVFGRGGEEALALEAAGVPYEVVPGVSSVAAVPAAAAIPVTHRGLSGTVTFATAHLAHESAGLGAPGPRGDAGPLHGGPDGWRRRCARAHRRGAVSGHARRCRGGGHLGAPARRRGNAATIASRVREAELGSPALLILGEVVSLRSQLRLAGGEPESLGPRRSRTAEAGHE